MRGLLERARNSSESTKKKIVWVGTIISMIVILILWGILNQLTQEKNPQQARGPLIPEEITSDVKQIGGVISEFRSKTSQLFDAVSELLNVAKEASTSTSSLTEAEWEALLSSTSSPEESSSTSLEN